jgi:hypothetical protein
MREGWMRGEKLIVWVQAELATALGLNSLVDCEREGLTTDRSMVNYLIFYLNYMEYNRNR